MQAARVCNGAVMLKKGCNRCKSRPVFSLFPFSSRAPPGHCLNAGDFASNRHFRHFLTPNQPRTTWSVQQCDVCSGLVLLTKCLNGCKSRPVFSLSPFSPQLPPGQGLNAGDFAPNRHFRHYPTPNRPRTTWCVQAHGVCSGPVMLNMGSNGCKS